MTAPAAPVRALSELRQDEGMVGIPNRKGWAFALGAAYARRRFARDLDGFFVAGLDVARAHCATGPVILAPTHSSWWDPLALLILDAALATDGRALMDATNLRRLPFFGAVGALPLHRGGSPGALRRDLARAVAHLDGPGKTLWIFPQGRQRPTALRPLGIEPGLRLLARQSGATVLPVALTYGFREAERPSAVARFSTPLPPRDPALLEAVEQALIAGLDEAHALLDQRGLWGAQLPEGSSFVALVPPVGRPGDQDPGARLLATLTRGLTRLTRAR